MKNFFKPRKLNIVDVVLLVLVTSSLLLAYTTMSANSVLRASVQNNSFSIQDINLEMESLGSADGSEASADMLNLIDAGYSSNVNRILYLEQTLGESLGLIGKINDWTIQTDIKINTLTDALIGLY